MCVSVELAEGEMLLVFLCFLEQEALVATFGGEGS